MTYATIEIPLVPEADARPIGSSPRDIGVSGTHSIIAAIRVRSALHAVGARLADGRPVTSYANMVQWLLEQAVAHELPESGTA